MLTENISDTPIAEEDVTTIEQESLVPYPVIKTVDGTKDTHPKERRIRDLHDIDLTTPEGRLLFGALILLSGTMGYSGKTPWGIIEECEKIAEHSIT